MIGFGEFYTNTYEMPMERLRRTAENTVAVFKKKDLPAPMLDMYIADYEAAKAAIAKYKPNLMISLIGGKLNFCLPT